MNDATGEAEQTATSTAMIAAIALAKYSASAVDAGRPASYARRDTPTEFSVNSGRFVFARTVARSDHAPRPTMSVATIARAPAMAAATSAARNRRGSTAHAIET